MIYKAKIVEVKKDVYQFSQEPFLNVEVNVLDDKDVVVDTKKFAYKADTSQEDIENDLQTMLTTFSVEVDQKEAQKETDELNAKADATVEALKDAEIDMP